MDNVAGVASTLSANQARAAAALGKAHTTLRDVDRDVLSAQDQLLRANLRHNAAQAAAGDAVAAVRSSLADGADHEKERTEM